MINSCAHENVDENAKDSEIHSLFVFWRFHARSIRKRPYSKPRTPCRD